MRCRRSSQPSSGKRRAGFSLFELMVTLGITGVAMTAVTKFFTQQAQTFAHQSYRLEAQQALRASLDNITRDLRLAGACLPTSTGGLVALDGVNAPSGDSITIRTGVIGTDGTCIKPNLRSDIATSIGQTSIQLDNATGFAAGMLAYIRHANGSAETHIVSSVSGNTLNLVGGLVQSYTASGVTSGGVYAMDERIYSLDKSNPAEPILLLQANRTTPQAFADGVHDLQVQYILDRNCPTCDVVDLPADETEWKLVNEVTVTATVKAVGTQNAGDQTAFVAEGRAKPRNLLP